MTSTERATEQSSLHDLYEAYYHLALCERVGPRSSYGADQTRWRGPYHLLRGYAVSGKLLQHPLVLTLLLKRLPQFRTQRTRAGDQNWEVGLPELLLSCPVLYPEHLRRIDQAAVANPELRWMRRAVADHPSTTTAVLESMIRRGAAEDAKLAEVIDTRLAALLIEREQLRYQRARRAKARRRLHSFLERRDPVGFALYLHHQQNTAVEDVLEAAGVGPTSDQGLVGGGRGASASQASDFDGEDLPSTISRERTEALQDGAEPTDDEISQWQLHWALRALDHQDVDQFDIWKLAPHHGRRAYAITWRDCDGRPSEYAGLYESVDQVRSSLAARYDALDLWFDKDA